MTAAIFVDTNIFVYSHDASEPAKQPLAARWLERLWEEQTGRTSMQVLNEGYFNLAHKLRPGMSAEDAWELVRGLLAWNPQPIDADLLVRGRAIEQRHRLSWWDSLIVAAAQAQNCSLLLSEDLHDHGVYGGVTVRNPFTLGISEAAATYTASPAARRHHRQRGRPKRSIMAA